MSIENKNVNYAYKAGALEGFIKNISTDLVLYPDRYGIDIVDIKLFSKNFDKMIADALKKADDDARNY